MIKYSFNQQIQPSTYCMLGFMLELEVYKIGKFGFLNSKSSIGERQESNNNKSSLLKALVALGPLTTERHRRGNI